MEDTGVTEKASDGGITSDGGTSVGVKLPGLFLTHVVFARLKTLMTKIMMETREVSCLR